jgi:hypothetical protein
MSSTFDEAVEAAWARFEGQLERALERLGDGSEVVSVGLDTEEGAAPYVQFAGSGGWIRCEVSSNKFLADEHRLDEMAHAALDALGWHEPDEDESPNWWFDIARDAISLAVSMTIGALRQVFGVVDPQFLVHDLAPRPRKQLPPKPKRVEREEFVIGWPESADELRDMVERALDDHNYLWERDEDGDFTVDNCAVSLWVSVSEQAALVRIWTVVLVQVERLDQAMIEVNILNRRSTWTKFYLDDDQIVAESEVPGSPLLASHLTDRVSVMLDAVGSVRRDLAERVGGFWVDRPSDQGVA